MVFDGLRAYLQLANGLTDVTKAKAMATARSLVQQSEAGVATMVPGQLVNQVGAIAEDLMATSRANRDLLLGLVRVEVERSVSRLGLVSASDLAAASARAQQLVERVQELERALRVALTGPAAGTPGTTSWAAPDAAPAARKATARRATARKTTAKKTARKATAKKATATRGGKATG